MRPGALLLALVFMGFALTAAVWLGNRGTGADSVQETPAPRTADSHEGAPPISETGPHPKAVIDDPEHDFGMMVVGEEGTHVFVIRNEGQAPLVLKKGQVTCRCTIGNLKDGAVPPGGSAEIELKWTPEERSYEFRQSAEVLTNDPERRSISLVLAGEVADLVTTLPSDEWHLGNIAEREPATISGSVVSMALDEFEVEGIETSGPLVTAEAVPLDEDRLRELRAKSGYEVRASIRPEMPIGRFREELKVVIVTPDGTRSTQTIALPGHRPGPIRILPTPGVDWIAGALALSLGTFPAAEGKTAELLMLVTVPEGLEFEITGIEPEEDLVRLTIAEEDAGGAAGHRRFRLTFEVPPGGPVVTRVRRESVKVRVLTNHPDMPELELKVELVAT